MIAHIIYDDRRPEKLELLRQEMLRQAISFMLWEAVRLPDIVASINASHRLIVEYAKRRQEASCLVMEDDVCFPAPDGFAYFLQRKPVDFDLYVAGTYGGVKAGKPLSNVGLHCYLIHEKYYNRFLSTDPTAHIDTAQDGADIHVCYPMAALQRPGWSWNNKSSVNYNTLLKPADVYGPMSEEMLQQS